MKNKVLKKGEKMKPNDRLKKVEILYGKMILDEKYVKRHVEEDIIKHMPNDFLARYRYLSNFEKLLEGVCVSIHDLKNQCYNIICEMSVPITKDWRGHYNSKNVRPTPIVDEEAFAKDYPELLDLVVKPDLEEIYNKLFEDCPDEIDTITLNLAEEKYGKEYIESTKKASIEDLQEILPYWEWEKYTKYTGSCSLDKPRQENFVVLPRGE